ncbi:MAG: thiamine-phosphate kinase [Candidatus Rokuibacteriota bacterium]|nr:MAG: thiamine-phosphate kinase [Candidatus Rokubacteria bacterium]
MSQPGAATERRLIEIIRRAARRAPAVRVGIGDDCAVLEPAAGSLLLATTDLLIEDVHFRRRWATPTDIGWKSLAVNVSDIAAMGGRPRWGLIALACPEAVTVEEAEAFYTGVQALATEHDVAIVGGDTSSSPRGWVVNVTLLGEAVRAPIVRSTARVGDVIAVTGSLGRSAAGLALLEANPAPAGVGGDARADVTSAHLRPRPRTREGLWLSEAGGVTSMIDLSDGLATDLGHLCEESGTGARVDLGRIPVEASVHAVARALDRDALTWATGGGEDYELLLTAAPDALDRLAGGLVRATGTKLTAVGRMMRAAEGIQYLDAEGHAVSVRPGFEHFVTGRARA